MTRARRRKTRAAWAVGAMLVSACAVRAATAPVSLLDVLETPAAADLRAERPDVAARVWYARAVWAQAHGQEQDQARAVDWVQRLDPYVLPERVRAIAGPVPDNHEVRVCAPRLVTTPTAVLAPCAAMPRQEVP